MPSKAWRATVRMATRRTRNVEVAAALFGAAVVCDALGGRDLIEDVEAPAALRTSAMLLIAWLSDPPLHGAPLSAQRAIATALLCAVAIAGGQSASELTRITDAIYSAIVLAALAFRFERGPTLDTHATTMRHFAAALSLYASLRVARRGAYHADVSASFQVRATAHDGAQAIEQGFAFSNAITAAALCAGGTAGAVFALLTLLHNDTAAQGMVHAGVVSSGVQFGSAFVATLAFSDQLVQLPEIFDFASCDVRAECPASFASRRFAAANASSNELWLISLGTLFFIYTSDVRTLTREQMDSTRCNYTLAAYGLSIGATCVLVLFSYVTFDVHGSNVVELLVLTVALATPWIAAFLDTALALLLLGTIIAFDQWSVLRATSAQQTYVYFTHISNTANVTLCAAFVVLSVVADVASRWSAWQHAVRVMDLGTGVVLAAGTSVATLLFTMTCALEVAYDGSRFERDAFRMAGHEAFAFQALVWMVQHRLPVLVWTPVYALRCEAAQLSARARSLSWYLPAFFVVFLWLLMMAVEDRSDVGDVYDSASMGVLALAVATVGLVPWLATAFT